MYSRLFIMGRSGQVSTGGREPVTESLQETAMNQNTSTAKHMACEKHKQIPNIEIQTQKQCLALDCYDSKQRLSQEPYAYLYAMRNTNTSQPNNKTESISKKI